MAGVTPRSSSRFPHNHTPKMSERKKGLFQTGERLPESLTQHRRHPAVSSASDSDDCDLGIISALHSSSEDEELGIPKTPERTNWHNTRSHTRRLLKDSHELMNFIKSPFTLKKYQTLHTCTDSKCTGSLSTPATPHLQNHPKTPSSTHSCGSIHFTSSTSSRARKSLASLIADTESCSSSLKDLTFDSDSSIDSKENTPTKPRRSSRRKKMTPKFQSFKGILVEREKSTNSMDVTRSPIKKSPIKSTLFSPMKTAVVCLTKMDLTSLISPTQMLKTPHTSEAIVTPPKLSHNRRSVIEIAESPENCCDSERSHKRLRDNSISENAPNSKNPKLDTNSAPKARLSLFNSERLKEILSPKVFYGKSNPELNRNVTKSITKALEVTTNSHPRRSFPPSRSYRRKRIPGQINFGVYHKIRKPKLRKNARSFKNTSPLYKPVNTANSTIADISMNNTSMTSQNTSQELYTDKADPFDKEKQTIDVLLSQWTEEEEPQSELELIRAASKPELPCFNRVVIEETDPIFQPVTAVPVSTEQNVPQDSDRIIVELGTLNNKGDESVLPQIITKDTQPGSGLPQETEHLPQDVTMAECGEHRSDHGEVPKNGQFLPVEGGYVLVDENELAVQGDVPDLDEIERELRMLDEQILKMAQSNNIDARAVLASTETALPAVDTAVSPSTPLTDETKVPKTPKLFPIFNKPNPGIPSSTPKAPSEKAARKSILKNLNNQYVIDAGQKKFGATQCSECGVIYQIGDPQDEHAHLVHHNSSNVLKFNGWKEEYCVGTWGGARCVRVRGGDAGWRRVELVLARVVHPYLGYPTTLPKKNLYTYTAYLYIEKKQIVGCLIVEPKTKAYKLLPGEVDCCSVEEFPVKCGVSRIWTHMDHRRRGVAARMLDCARASMLYGEALRREELAFSSPTEAGKALATSYCGKDNLYVYLD